MYCLFIFTYYIYNYFLMNLNLYFGICCFFLMFCLFTYLLMNLKRKKQGEDICQGNDQSHWLLTEVNQDISQAWIPQKRKTLDHLMTYRYSNPYILWWWFFHTEKKMLQVSSIEIWGISSPWKFVKMNKKPPIFWWRYPKELLVTPSEAWTKKTAPANQFSRRLLFFGLHKLGWK